MHAHTVTVQYTTWPIRDEVTMEREKNSTRASVADEPVSHPPNYQSHPPRPIASPIRTRIDRHAAICTRCVTFACSILFCSPCTAALDVGRQIVRLRAPQPHACMRGVVFLIDFCVFIRSFDTQKNTNTNRPTSRGCVVCTQCCMRLRSNDFSHVCECARNY